MITDEGHTSSINVAEACVAELLLNGVDTMFGVAGTHTLILLGAVEREPRLRYVTARTEVGAAAMAVGHARASGRPAAVLTSTGPGALNALSELADARWASQPLIHLTTSVGDGAFGGAVHETPEQSQAMGLLGKACVQVEGGAVGDAVRKAVAMAMAVPRGPVTLDMRVGTLGDPAARTSEQADVAEPAEPDLSEIVRAITAARRPVLFVGGGAIGSDEGRAALRLAEQIGAPIVSSYQGKMITDWNHPGYLGPWAGEQLVQDLCADSDFALVLGSKLSSAGTDSWRLPIPEGSCRVDASPLPHPHYPGLHTVCGDAATVARHLVTAVPARPPWAADRVAGIRASVISAARERGPVEMGYLNAIACATATPRLVAGDMTKVAFWAVKYLPARTGSVQALSSYLAMGTALPMAIGMSVATGEPVLALVGDGGLQMSIAELATLAELQLPVSVVVLVDQAYGLLRDNGRAVRGSESVGVALWNPDFELLAQAYGIEVISLTSCDDLLGALGKPADAPRLLLLTEGFARRW